jgi:lipopolysaccharide export system protein LptA
MMKKIIAIALMGLTALNAAAEKADARKGAVIDYDTLLVDEVTQITTLTGNVILTKGTLMLRAEKAVLKQSPEKDIHVSLTTTAGKRTSFRQKRDGGPDLWAEGEAQRIDYDERTEVVTLIGGAHIRRLEGGIMTDEIKGEFTSYDGLLGRFVAKNDASGVSKAGQGRNQLILAPAKPRAATPAAPAVSPAPVDAS